MGENKLLYKMINYGQKREQEEGQGTFLQGNQERSSLGFLKFLTPRDITRFSP